MKRGFDPEDVSRSLTFEEKVRVAYGYHVLGVAQHDLAALFGVNAGRIAEACKAVERAIGDKPQQERV